MSTRSAFLMGLLSLLLGCGHAGEFQILRESGGLFAEETWNRALFRANDDGTLEILCLRESPNYDPFALPGAGPEERDLLYLLIPPGESGDPAVRAEWYPGSQGAFIGYEALRGEVKVSSPPGEPELLDGSFRLEMVLRYPSAGSHPYVLNRVVLIGSFSAELDPDEVQATLGQGGSLRRFLEEESTLDSPETLDELEGQERTAPD